MKNVFAIIIILLIFPFHAFAQEVAAPESHVYRKIDTLSLKAYVFLPTNSNKDRPAILLFHGGAWTLGEASWTFKRAKEFAEKGMVAISVEYRLTNNMLSPIDAIEDACAAFKWTRMQAKTFNIDKTRIAGYGVSAGGHLVASAAVLPSVREIKIDKNSRPNALLLFSPALNMAHDPYFMSLMEGKGDPSSYSPSDFISNGLPPTLIIQGEQDSIVFANDARDFRNLAEKIGAKCVLYVYPHVGHLLTRNLKVQYKDFDGDPADEADAHQREDDFLVSIGYIKK